MPAKQPKPAPEADTLGSLMADAAEAALEAGVAGTAVAVGDLALDLAAALTPDGVGMVLADMGVATDFAKRIRDH